MSQLDKHQALQFQPAGTNCLSFHLFGDERKAAAEQKKAELRSLYSVKREAEPEPDLDQNHMRPIIQGRREFREEKGTHAGGGGVRGTRTESEQDTVENNKSVC